MDCLRFSRSEALLGEAAMTRLQAAHVMVVGVGGVGSWCAEALVRTGLGHITLVDDDTVVESNLNRQCPATTSTLGRPKVDAMRDRLLAINPACEVTALNTRYPLSPVPRSPFPVPCSPFPVPSSPFPVPCSPFPVPCSLIIDAIDSVDCKAELILDATSAGIPLVSSMGAALRTDPTRVRVTRFEKVEGDGLARALRQRFKKLRRFPAKRFACVWSTEPAKQTIKQSNNPTIQQSNNPTIQQPNNPTIQQSNNPTISKGSLMPVTATFGMCLASEAINLLTKGNT